MPSYAAPHYCSRLTGHAPALLLTAQDDPLRDEGVAFAHLIFPILAVAHATDGPISLSPLEAYVAPSGKSDTAIASQFPWFDNANKAALLLTESIDLLIKLGLKVSAKTLVTRVDGPAHVLFAAYAAILTAAAGLRLTLSVAVVANIPSAEAFA